MKILIVLSIACLYVSYTSASCNEQFKCIEKTVNDLLNEQIKTELKGHYTYLYLSHLFMKHDLYYPKVSKYFRAKSDEEMQHAERFIQYQNQRGGSFSVSRVNRMMDHPCNHINSLRKGFTCAKKLEIHVTEKLTQLLQKVSNVKNITADCPSINEEDHPLLYAQPILVTYTQDGSTEEQTSPLEGLNCTGIRRFSKVEYVELAEMITHEFLGHQLEDTKELANFESTLKGMDSKLGSFLADKHFDL